MPPTRGSPLAARLLSPGIYIWRPPRSRPIPSLTAPDLHRYRSRDDDGKRQSSWALSWSTPRGTSNHVRRARLRPRVARGDRSARAPRVPTPVPRPFCGRHRSGVCVPLGGPAGVRLWQSHRRGASRACRAASAGRAHHVRRRARRAARCSRERRAHDVRTCEVASRPVRGLCLEFCRDSGCCRCVRARTRVVPCGALLAAVEVAIEVARRAIAPMSTHAAGGH